MKDVNNGSEYVKTLRGKEGLKLVLIDVLNTLHKNEVFYRYSARDPKIDVKDYMTANYRTLRNKKKIQQFVITHEALRNNPYQKRVDCDSRVLPSDESFLGSNTSLLIYGTKVVYVDFNIEEALMINNKDFATFHKKIFKELYNRLLF